MTNVPEPVLVDRRNFDQFEHLIGDRVAEADMIGIDCETEDSNRHPGLEAYNTKDRHVFDTNRSIMTGLSLWPEGDDQSYYFNLRHADTENRVPFEVVAPILDNKRDDANWVAHNAPFELVMFENCVGYTLRDMICSLQLCVTAYGPDEYPIEAFRYLPLGAIDKLIPEIAKTFASWDGYRDLTPDQYKVLGKVTGKQSKAAHSYKGYIDEIAYGYNLKKAVKSWFNYQMMTYEECLNGKEHMGQLTGEEVVSYGADDAFWTVKLFRRVIDYLMERNPGVIKTFFEQENPMIYAYADAWRQGVLVNKDAISERTDQERHEFAELSRKLKGLIREMLPFPEEPNETLCKLEKWYFNPEKGKEGWKTKRQEIIDWANIANDDDDFKQVTQFSNAVGNAWSGVKPKNAVSLMHYMPLRTIYYDLFDDKPIVSKGKVQSDADCRGTLIEKWKASNDNDAPLKVEILDTIGKMASVEQRMKLYLTPYGLLTDPDTGRLYPVLSSKLATRRMATQYPSPMQLSKRGESTYVRGFFLAG